RHLHRPRDRPVERVEAIGAGACRRDLTDQVRADGGVTRGLLDLGPAVRIPGLGAGGSGSCPGTAFGLTWVLCHRLLLGTGRSAAYPPPDIASEVMSQCCGPSRDGTGAGGAVPQPEPAGAPVAAVPTGGTDHSDWPVIPAGSFRMGSEAADVFPDDGEGPVRTVTVGGFRISPTTVTNAEFGEFVAATGHVTDAERFGWS